MIKIDQPTSNNKYMLPLENSIIGRPAEKRVNTSELTETIIAIQAILNGASTGNRVCGASSRIRVKASRPWNGS